MYKQGHIIIVRYPLSDKLGKSIIRPVLVVSNESSNSQDKDLLVCQITTKLRKDKFSCSLTDHAVTVPLPEAYEVRCNKIATVRIWDEIILDKISEVIPEALSEMLALVKSVF